MPADLESLSEFYQNRGYFDFKVTNAGSAAQSRWIKPELNMKISVNEGQRYRFGQVAIAGDLLDVPPKKSMI